MNFHKYFKSTTLINNPLCGIDTYKDVITLTTGQLTRAIEKLVLTGQENWVKSNAYQGSFYATIVENSLSETYTSYCSHLTFTTQSEYAKGKFCFNGGVIKNCNLWFNQFDSRTTVEEFKSYLAQQYSTGIPVTVWYVLATPKTEQITVPSGLSGTVEGYLTQSGTPTPTDPIYPVANNAVGWYGIKNYVRNTTWQDGSTYSRSGGSWSSALTKKRSRKRK